MKRYVLLIAVMTAGACHRGMAPWPYEGDKQSVTLQVRTNDLVGFSALPPSCQLFVYDENNGKTLQYQATSGASNNQYQVKLFPGTYMGYCVTNAENTAYWDYKETSTPEKIYLKSQSQGGSNDHLIGCASLKISTESPNTFTFDMQRKVGKLLVVIDHIPEWLTDLKIGLNNIPKNISLTGEVNTSTHSVSCIAAEALKGESVTEILVFPPPVGKRCTLTLSSETHAYLSDPYVISEIIANKITRINIIFKDFSDMSQMDFTTSIVEWDKDTMKEEDWEIQQPFPDNPCTGSGDGHNLVINPGFEEALIDNLPPGWKLDAGGTDKKVVHTSHSTRQGNYAIRLDGKTYLYQDIAVREGQCYQLKMFVNAPNPATKWRYWCTWIKGSANLPSDKIRSSSYQYQTEGYIDVFNGQNFRAPSGATKLRMEIRTYTTSVDPATGLYLDGVSVENVN